MGEKALTPNIDTRLGIKHILERYGHNQNDLAMLLGRTYQSISMKLNGKHDFTLSEVRAISLAYNLTAKEIFEIFISSVEQDNNETEEQSVDKNLTLKDILIKNKHSQNDLANLLGKTYQCMSLKLNGKNDFTLSEIRIIALEYKLTAEEVFNIFISKMGVA